MSLWWLASIINPNNKALCSCVLLFHVLIIWTLADWKKLSNSLAYDRMWRQRVYETVGYPRLSPKPFDHSHWLVLLLWLKTLHTVKGTWVKKHWFSSFLANFNNVSVKHIYIYIYCLRYEKYCRLAKLDGVTVIV